FTLLLSALLSFHISRADDVPALAVPPAGTPLAIPTFHCLGLYWSPPGGAAGHPVRPGYGFIKMGFAGGVQWMTGHQYIFHNTIFAEDGWLPTGGLGGNRIVKHTISRNNILHVRSALGRSVSSSQENIDNDFDYDLFNASV